MYLPPSHQSSFEPDDTNSHLNSLKKPQIHRPKRTQTPKNISTTTTWTEVEWIKPQHTPFSFPIHTLIIVNHEIPTRNPTPNDQMQELIPPNSNTCVSTLYFTYRLQRRNSSKFRFWSKVVDLTSIMEAMKLAVASWSWANNSSIMVRRRSEGAEKTLTFVGGRVGFWYLWIPHCVR